MLAALFKAMITFPGKSRL